MYKFIHLFTVDSPIYNKSYQDLIFKSQDYTQHLFVYLHEKSFNSRKILENTILIKSRCSVELIKDLQRKGEYVIIHNLAMNNRELCKMDKDIASRCIWCVWGPDLYRNIELIKPRSFIYRTLRFLYHILKYHELYTQRKLLEEVKKSELVLNEFKAICAGFEGDIEEIYRRFPLVSVFQALYPGEFYYEDIKKWDLKKEEVNTSTLKILLGHCGTPLLQHKKWLKRLIPFASQIELYLPLGYGNKSYSDRIERYAKRKFGENVHIYRNKMETEKYYLDILSKVDIAIFDFSIQCAYGNAMLLFHLNKKIFYPKNSVMYNGFLKNGAKVYALENLNIQQLINNKTTTVSEENVTYAQRKMMFSSYLQQWNAFYSSLR